MSSIDNRTKLGVMAFAGVGIALVMALLILPSFAGQDTYIFTGGNSGGSNSTSECVNLASQYNIILNTTNNTCYVRDLANGNGITMSTNGTHVIITNSKPESTLCTPDGAGNSLCGTTANVGLKTLSAGTSITIDCSVGQNCVITNSAPESTNCNNVGAGTVIHVTSSNCNAKSLKAGTGISITSNSTVITITNTLPEATACSDVGTGNGLCGGGNVNIKSLIAGTGVTISDTTNDWTFASQCANTGSGEAICESSNNINSLIATSPITVSDTTGDLTIACSTCVTTSSAPIELCRDTASSGDTSMGCTLSSNTKFIHIEIIADVQTSSWTASYRFNSDTDTDYDYRISSNGGADSTSTNVAQCRLGTIGSGTESYSTIDVSNPASGEQKLGISEFGDFNGVDTAPNRAESVCVYEDTGQLISSVNFIRESGTGTLTSNSLMVVYGHD